MTQPITQKDCKHCGLPSAGQAFCCMGCKFAWHLIHEHGLHAFYESAEPSLSAVNPSEPDEFSLFDNVDFLKNFSQKTGDTREGYFSIEGLYCTACIWLIENLPRLCSDCIEARVFFSESRVFLKWKDKKNSLSSIASQLLKIGYRLHPEKMNIQKKKDYNAEWVRLGVSGGFAFACMHIGLYFLGAYQNPMEPDFARNLGFISALLSLPVLTYGALPYFRSTFFSLKLKRLQADLLVTAAIIIGFSFSLFHSFHGSIEVYYDSLSMVVFLLLCGRMLLRKTTDFVTKPIALEAHKLRGETIETVPATSLKIGDFVILKQNELAPAELELCDQEAWIDESVITGESSPQLKWKEQKIKWASKNLGDPIHAKVVETYSPPNKTLENSSSSNSKWEPFFVGGVFLLSLIPLSWGDVEKSISILIVACPCALALSKPLVLDALRRQAAQKGVLFSRLDRCLNLRTIKTVFFDKTGTLSQGNLKLCKIHIIKDESSEKFQNEKELLDIVFSLSQKSDHPLSKTLAFFLYKKEATSLAIEAVQEKIGHGTFGTYKGSSLCLKSSLKNQAQSGCSLFINNKERIQFSFEDSVRPESKESLDLLKKDFLKLVCLSGDKENSVHSFIESNKLNFDTVISQKTPEEKRGLMNQNSLMVGDGLNDAKAMKAAGFSIGLSGSAESNLKSADAYLIKKDLRLVFQLMKASKKAFLVLQRNYGISVLYNIITISLVMTGALGPVLCAIFMPLSSLTVIALAQTPRYFKDLD